MGATRGKTTKRKPRLRLHQSLRWVHTYLSMFSLLLILFFALTGITLNHPEWTFGIAPRERKVTGRLAPEALNGGEVDWLRVAEQLRAEQGLRGRVADPRVDAGEGSLSFKGPGYSADAFFKVSTGEYEVTTEDAGFVALMNDFHRGRDLGPAWTLAIDASGVVLALVALTGLGILFYLKKSRVVGLTLVALGGIVLAVAIVLLSR
ncbi:peptidase [bacterium]|nr:MAG: peptidase [bacterium]